MEPSETKNSINDYDFFKFIIYIRDGQCDYSPWRQKA